MEVNTSQHDRGIAAFKYFVFFGQSGDGLSVFLYNNQYICDIISQR